MFLDFDFERPHESARMQLRALRDGSISLLLPLRYAFACEYTLSISLLESLAASLLQSGKLFYVASA